jgi:TonB-linked SusC/RagA family outer membrane protein
MKKLFLLMVLFVFVSANALLAQTKVITGTVASAVEDEGPIPGVTVQVKGTTIGAVTDENGKYTINVPQNATTLVFSYIGMKSQEVAIAGRSVIDGVMESDILGLDEVVVTALGISREKKALGYAVQDVKGEELSRVRTQNVIGSLSGRVAGVQVTQASGQMGGGAKMNIRGNSSLTKNNQPLFVVDGIPLDNSDYSYGATGAGGYDLGNMASDINPDDIESMTVLKGASASALYGSRAANGVVMVTTKKGKVTADKQFGVSVNSSLTFDQAKYFPKYQKLYGGGYGGFETIEIDGVEYNYPNYEIDESWGPKLDPNVKVLPWNAFDPYDAENYMKEVPWVYPENDYTYFFKTGVNYTNNVAISASNSKGGLRLSYTNMDVKGIYPNSTLKKNTVNLNGNVVVNRFIDTWINANYVQNSAVGRPETGYGDRNPVQKMWQWIHSNVDYKDLENYLSPLGEQRTWNRNWYDDPSPAYTDNPYWSAYKNFQNDRRDRFYGNYGFNLNLLPWVKFTGRMGADYYKFNTEERMAIGSQATSEYYKSVYTSLDVNTEAFFTVNHRFTGDQLGVSAIIGVNRLDRKYWRDGGISVGGLMLPELYNLSNSFNKPDVYDYQSWKRINSAYANASIDFNRMLFLELTGRNDWSSTLPEGARSFFYPSATLSFVLTELSALKDNAVLSYAKIRGGVAQVGNDTNPYDLLNYITLNPSFLDGSFNLNPMMNLNNTLANPDLKPERTNSWEIGTELKFFQNRVNLDVSYFYKETIDQIIPVRVSAAGGYGFKNINAGKMSNKGIEVALGGTVISTGDFSWDIALNIATLTNKVEEIDEGLDYLTLGSGPFKVQSGAYVGMSYPIIYGTDFVKDSNGNIILTTDGMYIPSEIKPLADVTPDFTAGLTNSFRFKGFDMNILLDMQRGGNMYYLSYMWGMYSGIIEESAQINELGNNIREDETEGGGVLLDGVYGEYNTVTGAITYFDAEGNESNVPVKNTTRLNGQLWAESHYDGPDTQNIFDTDFIKLREISLGYSVPTKWTGPVKGVRLSAFARNLAIFGAATKHFDPEYLQMSGSNAQGIEGGYLPSTVSYGFGLNFNF